MTSSSVNPEALLAGFENAGGWYDKELFSLAEIPEMGIGAVALKDIPASPYQQLGADIRRMIHSSGYHPPSYCHPSPQLSKTSSSRRNGKV